MARLLMAIAAGRHRLRRPPAFDDGRYYDRAGYGRAPPRDRRNDRPNRRCDRGTGGTILGAIAGGLIGNAAAGRGDRGAGTVVGAGVGALAGRAIDRDC
ncbi:glycine zipper 2TM domain-containing protein [Sphingomonas sp. MMS24-J13]|uniref:glycine zipper 2TM domain-containing protein n=1 Tax=Sphingomonas sp. MMS24-J13 TaxID=3238686 RepID=UPI00384AA923